ncbi:MAG: metallophosphoesterase [Candidatus Latescibacterota bacterium]
MKWGMLLLFLGIYVALYGGLHAYVFWKMLILLPRGRWAIMALFALLVAAPFGIAGLSHAGLNGPATVLSWVGYTWMGVVFLFFSFSVGLDLYRLLVETGARLLGIPGTTRWLLSPFHSVVLAIVLTLTAAGYGFFAARQIPVRRITIPSSKRARSSDSFRIVQITDLHLGLLSDERRLRRLIEVIESVRPDVVVSTGDLVDVPLDQLGEFADLLHELKPRLGKFAVTGNHEAYAGPDQSRAFTQRAGFAMLSHDGVSVNSVVNIVGVDDPAVSHRLKRDTLSESDLLQRYPRDEFTVLLKHRPAVGAASSNWFDLQLSGHTHGGQIFPFGWLARLVYPARTGLSAVGETSWLYLSRGTGTWGPPIRFLAPPEVTVIDLESVHAAPGI